MKGKLSNVDEKTVRIKNMDLAQALKEFGCTLISAERYLEPKETYIFIFENNDKLRAFLELHYMLTQTTD